MSILGGIATICKYSSDFLKLRKDRKSSEKSETIHDYVEWCRRRDHTSEIERLDLIDRQLSGFEQLLAALWDLNDAQGLKLLEAIGDGNLSVLEAIQVQDESVHAKLDKIIHLLGVVPQRLFPADPPSWHNNRIKGFESRYLDRARREFGRLEMLGVPGTQHFHQDLDIAYVSLELIATDQYTEQQGSRGEEVFASYRRLTVRGPAGSGKTTLLRWVALKCAMAANVPNSPWNGGVPLFVPLRKLKGGDRGRPDEKKTARICFRCGGVRRRSKWLAPDVV